MEFNTFKGNGRRVKDKRIPLKYTAWEHFITFRLKNTFFSLHFLMGEKPTNHDIHSHTIEKERYE